MDVLKILIELLRFKSITPKDDGIFNFINILMGEFEAKFIDAGDTKNLFLTKEFGHGPHLCFAGHIDVVPPGENWETDPFKPVQKDGYIYARGTQDMKSGVAAMLWACMNAKNFGGRLSILLTSDEEGDGTFGTRYALNEIEKMGLMPDFCVVGEPTCEMEFGDTIKIGRRGSVNGILKIYGKQGHAAYPAKCINPAHQLASVFSKFAGHDLDNGSEFFEPSKIVITDIRGGMEVCNVTPSEICVMFNVRNSELTSFADIQSYCANLFGEFNYDLELKLNSSPFLTDSNSQIAQKLATCIKNRCEISPKFSTGGGTSDARHFAAFGVKVVEFGVINDRIHAKNERVATAEVENLAQIYLDLINEFGKNA